MSSVLPGQPQSKLQALTYGTWKDTHVNVTFVCPVIRNSFSSLINIHWQVYITGSAIAILGSTNTIFQTIYDDSEAELHAVTIDEASGKIAAATKTTVRIYRPSNTPEDPFKVVNYRNPNFETLFNVLLVVTRVIVPNTTCGIRALLPVMGQRRRTFDSHRLLVIIFHEVSDTLQLVPKITKYSQKSSSVV